MSYGNPQRMARHEELLLDELKGGRSFSNTFCGKVSRDSLTNLFQVPACHIYLTYPFFKLEFTEAMSCQSPIVASNTEPVKEFQKITKILI